MTALENTNYTEQLIGSIKWVLPEIVLVGAACLLFVLAVFYRSKLVHAGVALAAILAAGALAAIAPEMYSRFEPSYSGIDPTGAAAFIRWFALGATALFALVSYREAKLVHSAEYYGCLLIVGAGVSLVGRANDLVLLFLALEMISIPTYVLLYLPSQTKQGQEAAVKYFTLSVLSSAVLLFGLSYFYGVAGSTNITTVVAVLSTATQSGMASPLALVAAVLVIAGLGFRIAAVPFHFYAPDVYDGGPLGVVAQLAVFPKLAGFVALARLFGLFDRTTEMIPFDVQHTLIPLTLWVIAVVTMTLGNVLALLQQGIKRMFAYSGIAHGGYMLIGVLVASGTAATFRNHSGLDVLLFYLVAYTLMTVGTFAVLAYLNTDDRSVETLDDLAGLGQTNPFAAALLSVFLLSLIGMPLTAGFIGKFNLFIAAFEMPTDSKMKSMYRILTVIAVVNSAISAVYYLRMLGIMFLRSPLKPVTRTRGALPLTAAVFCAVGTLVFGVWPTPLLKLTQEAAPVVTAKLDAVAVARNP